MISILIGIMFLAIGIIHGLWTISAFIRAKKAQWPLRWPISGRWVLVFYSLSLTLFFLDVVRIRILYADTLGDSFFELALRSFVLLMTCWAMWRWLFGNLIVTRKDDE